MSHEDASIHSFILFQHHLKMSSLLINSKTITNDILNEILEHIWTGRESRIEYGSLFSTHPLYRLGRQAKEKNTRFDTLVSLSLSCWTFRRLSLPRLFGTIVILQFKTLGLLWRALQLNPSLGSYVHTFSIKYESQVWPGPVVPSEAMQFIFNSRTIESMKEEAKKRKDVEWNEELQSRLEESFILIGPDGEGFDANIRSPEDLKEALVDCFRSFTNLKSLRWSTSDVPFLTEIVESLVQSGSLESLEIKPAACEEDYFLGPVSRELHPPTPLHLLTRNLREFKVGFFGVMPRDYSEDMDETGPLLQRSIQTFIQAVQALKSAETLDLGGMTTVGKEDGRPWILLEILPYIACIPRLKTTGNRPRGWQQPLSNLFADLNKIAERKRVLASEDVQALGKEAKEEVDHPLSKLAEYLQEPELSRKIAERWNQRYSNSRIFEKLH